MKKKALTSKQIYKKNRTKHKVFKILAPIVYWLALSLTIVFGAYAVKNSVGNVTEIIQKLDKKTYNTTEIADNYAALVEKYGEWTVVGYNGSTFSVTFIDINRALFSGLMKLFVILTFSSLTIAIVFGKIVLPKLAEYYKDNNQDMVNLATLDTQEIVRKKIDKKEDEGWF